MSGLATLTHTPSSIGFITRILDAKKKNSRCLDSGGCAFFEATVSAITKKELTDALEIK